MSEHNITVQGGSSVRLKTAGKYCDRDILVRAEAGGVELPELTNEGGAADLMEGKQLINGEGKVVDGAFTLYGEMTEQSALIAKIKSALAGKAAGEGTATQTQEKTVKLTENGTFTIVPDAGYVLSRVGVNVSVPIPEGYIKPTGTLSVTENGTHDAEHYKSVSVNVPVPDGYIMPSGTLQVTENGTHNAKQYESVAVNVPIPDGYIKPSGTKTVTENGSHDVTAHSTVNVNVPIPDGYIVPSGTKEISANGTYDVTDKKSVVVSVPEREVVLQNKEVTENGTYTADAGYDGLGQVIVNVQTGGGGSAEPDDKDLYQRVEYITSAEEGTYPYIITDFYADNESGIEVVASFPILQDRIPMGSRQDSGTTRFYCVYPMSANSIYYGFNTGSSVSCQLKVDTIYRCQTNFLNSRLVNVYDEDGIRKGGTSLSATLTTHTAPVSIFGYNNASTGAVSSKREYKLYGARCSKKHEVVREYIPCYRKSDGVVGLYEKCTGQFLTSEIDAGFAKGADIDW